MSTETRRAFAGTDFDPRWLENDAGAWMETSTGRVVYPLNLKPADVCLEDVAHHLSAVCRYNGATRRHYSVAEHSVLVALHLEADGWAGAPTRLLNALLHDAAEAYLQDVIGPIKSSFPLMAAAERSALLAVHEALRVPYIDSAMIRGEIKLVDRRICLDERAALLPRHDPRKRWGVDRLEPLGVEVKGLPARRAKALFLRTFARLAADLWETA